VTRAARSVACIAATFCYHAAILVPTIGSSLTHSGGGGTEMAARPGREDQRWPARPIAGTL